MATKETLNTRVTRLETTMAELAKSQARLDNALAHLAEVQAETKQQMAQLGKETDDRIQKLVGAIGEFQLQFSTQPKAEPALVRA